MNYGNFGYTSFPLVYGTQDYGAMGAAGITQVREQPFLALRGTGTLIGIVDTGIRYEHEAFVREDGSSIIDAVWDQTAENADSFSFNTERELNNMVMYGRVYANAMINEALSAPNPQEIVPVTDAAGGHGTMLAGLAAGQEKPEQGFTGAAPGARLVVVKLRQAKRYLRDLYLVNDNALCYSEIDIILGIRFLQEYAREVRMPISIIVGLGTNISSHRGSTVLSIILIISAEILEGVSQPVPEIMPTADFISEEIWCPMRNISLSK